MRRQSRSCDDSWIVKRKVGGISGLVNIAEDRRVSGSKGECESVLLHYRDKQVVSEDERQA
jgi:hypothetical protein